MRGLLLFIFLLLSIQVFAQYKTVYPDRTTFYKYKNEVYDYGKLGMIGYTGEHIPLKIESRKIAPYLIKLLPGPEEKY